MWLVYYCGIITYTFISGMMSNMDINNSRFDDDELNANTIAYATFYLTFALFMLGEISENRKTYNLLFFFTIPLSFFISLVTASRQVLVIQIPLIFFLVAIRYMNVLNHAKIFVICLSLMVAIGFVVGDKVANTYHNSLLAQRSKTDVKEDFRAKLLKDAFMVGMEHPITGVGPGNYYKFSYKKHFSHCTYTELFANHGIPGVSLWVLMLFVFIKKQITYYRKSKDKIFLIFIAFGMIFCIDNVFYVFHNCIFLMPMFLIVGSHSEKYYHSILSKLQNEYENT